MTDRDITGLMVKRYHTCYRELWFYAHRIDVDTSNPGISHGTYIDETSYGDDTESLFIDGTVAIDLLEGDTVVEVKRSSRLQEAAEMQLKYYLWYLETEKDLHLSGELAVPRERKRVSVELTDDDRELFPGILTEIQEIMSQPSPPAAEEKPFCDSCAYHDLCWV